VLDLWALRGSDENFSNNSPATFYSDKEERDMIVYLFLAGISIYVLVVYYLCLKSEMPDLQDVREEY
jgi:hypothetical protein